MLIRHAVPGDLESISAIEAQSFPAAEAASEASIRSRLAVFADRFWVAQQEGQTLGFVNGMLTNESDLRDVMFDEAAMHTPSGAWQMLFSVATHPAARRRGIASGMLRRVIADCRAEGRKGIVLTCKEALVPFYHRLGFVDEGVSRSEHGGAVWKQMRLCLDGPVLTVKRVLEDDFGCEGLPEGQEKQVTLLCSGTAGNTVVLRMDDALALSRSIDAGQPVLQLQDGSVIRI